MREKIKGVEHWVVLGVVLVVVGGVLWWWMRRKSHKPKLSDVALEKVAERVHRHEETHVHDQDSAPRA